jgi:hypothetical protein
VIGKPKTQDTAVADPFGFITQFAGAGKTVGAAAGAARGLRSVEHRQLESSRLRGPSSSRPDSE